MGAFWYGLHVHTLTQSYTLIYTIHTVKIHTYAQVKKMEGTYIGDTVKCIHIGHTEAHMQNTHCYR